MSLNIIPIQAAPVPDVFCGFSLLRTSDESFSDTMPPVTLNLSLIGAFKLTTHSGTPINIGSTMSRRLLAILARAPGHRRSRSMLQMLLWDETANDPAANLRQLVLKTRRKLGEYSDCLVASSTSLELKNIVEVFPAASSQVDFFEDAGIGTEDFEDWLRSERMSDVPFDQTKTGSPAISIAPPQKPRLLLNGLSQKGSQPPAHLSESITVLLRDVFCKSDFLDLLEPEDGHDVAGDTHSFEVELIAIGGSFVVALWLRSTTGRVWSHSFRIDGAQSPRLQFDHIQEQIYVALELVERHLDSISSSRKSDPLYGLVSRILTFDPREVQRATDHLSELPEVRISASTLAWQAFGRMLQNGERLVDDRDLALGQAEQLIERALSMDAANPSALAVASQFHSYVLRDYRTARRFSDAALLIAPQAAFVQDVRAMIELYENRIESAHEHAEVAARVGQFGPMRHYVSATLVMTSTLRKDHRNAIRLGRMVLNARPKFLPVLRHMSASLVTEGRLEEARQLIDRTRQIDPKFATSEMADESYPMPSSLGRELIANALLTHDLIE